MSSVQPTFITARLSFLGDSSIVNDQLTLITFSFLPFPAMSYWLNYWLRIVPIQSWYFRSYSRRLSATSTVITSRVYFCGLDLLLSPAYRDLSSMIFPLLPKASLPRPRVKPLTRTKVTMDAAHVISSPRSRSIVSALAQLPGFSEKTRKHSGLNRIRKNITLGDEDHAGARIAVHPQILAMRMKWATMAGQMRSGTGPNAS